MLLQFKLKKEKIYKKRLFKNQKDPEERKINQFYQVSDKTKIPNSQLKNEKIKSKLKQRNQEPMKDH